MWATKVQKNYPETSESGQFWRSTMLDMDSRLRVAQGIAKTETDASINVFETLKERGHPDHPPATISDGWGGERTHLTMRHFSARLTRKSLAFSKKLSTYQAAAALQDGIYNLVRPLKTLRQALVDDTRRRWQPRTPAMAANLTDSIWTVKSY